MAMALAASLHFFVAAGMGRMLRGVGDGFGNGAIVLQTQTDIASADELITTLLNMNGFTAPRDDLSCGAEHDHAGCNPAGSTPCCSSEGKCIATSCLDGWCNSAGECDGHNHLLHHKCNGDETGAARKYGCVSKDARNPLAKALQSSSGVFQTDDASLKARTHPADVSEARMLLLYKLHKIDRTIAAVKLVPDSNANKRTVIAKLTGLAKETDAKRALLTTDMPESDLDQDFLWIQSTKVSASRRATVTVPRPYRANPAHSLTRSPEHVIISPRYVRTTDQGRRG